MSTEHDGQKLEKIVNDARNFAMKINALAKADKVSVSCFYTAIFVTDQINKERRPELWEEIRGVVERSGVL